MELVLRRNRRGEGRTLKTYDLGSYEVSAIIYDTGWHSIYVSTNGSNRYQPNIYTRDDLDGNIHGFVIQTTSYGAIPADQVRKVIEGLEEAAEVVDILTKEFVREGV